jgi:RimJ/RimL family protein N-acetyltransferase
MEIDRHAVEWAQGTRLRLFEPTLEEVRAVAAELALHYNEPQNRALMTNEQEFSAEDVVELFEDMWKAEGHPFLLEVDGVVIGDADLRNVDGDRAEFAIMVGPRGSQAKGLGTRFATMALLLAFGPLGLKRVYASIRPENTGSLRMFEKVGYVRDSSADARRYAELPDDVCVSIDPAHMRRAQPETIAEARVSVRPRRTTMSP